MENKNQAKSPFIQIIFTTEKNGQLVGNFNWSPAIIETKEALVKFAYIALCGQFQMRSFNRLTMQDVFSERVEMPRLAKLSCCIYADGTEISTPEWYNNNNGKVYFNENGEAK